MPLVHSSLALSGPGIAANPTVSESAPALPGVPGALGPIEVDAVTACDVRKSMIESEMLDSEMQTLVDMDGKRSRPQRTSVQLTSVSSESVVGTLSGRDAGDEGRGEGAVVEPDAEGPEPPVKGSSGVGVAPVDIDEEEEGAAEAAVDRAKAKRDFGFAWFLAADTFASSSFSC
jgi:hypothetical protein